MEECRHTRPEGARDLPSGSFISPQSFSRYKYYVLKVSSLFSKLGSYLIKLELNLIKLELNFKSTKLQRTLFRKKKKFTLIVLYINSGLLAPIFKIDFATNALPKKKNQFTLIIVFIYRVMVMLSTPLLPGLL